MYMNWFNECDYEWGPAFVQAIQTGIPIPDDEHKFVHMPECVLWYALYVKHGRWIEGEPTVLTASGWALEYTKSVIKQPWPEAEAIIATNPETSYMYARDMLKAPFPLGEKAIARRRWLHLQYLKMFGGPL